MTKKNLFVLIILLSIVSNIFSQNINIEVITNNKDGKINNASATIIVKNGNLPIKYKWPIPSVSLDSNTASGLTEGKEYNIEITDALGYKTTQLIYIESISINEKINSFFIPFVDNISQLIMTDIFAKLNLYNPQKHDDNGDPIFHPNGDPNNMSIPLVVVWLIIGALFFTIKLRFINFRGFKHAIHLVQGKYDDPNDHGEVSHFQALTTALSATVGLGNIAGVAIAISIGGPGATLWMILAGFLGMASKFAECTLGVKYRKISEDGEVSGGPMYYLSNALKKKNLGKLGKFLSIIFAILVVGGSFGGGNMFQANQAFEQISTMIPSISHYGWIFGVFLAFLVGIVIIGGIKGIAKVTDKIVPFMALLYVLTALIIIIINIDHTYEAIKLIINGAFSPSALKGGVVGVLILGFQRAAFSNEAGIGSASIAHSAAKTEEPVSEGIVALLEPFIDTVVICTMTALVLIFTNSYDNTSGLQGAQLTSSAFGSVISWFPWLLSVAILLFAFSTMISWSYYGLKGFDYLFSSIIKNKKTLKNIYFSIFLFFIVVGSASELGAVVDFSDMMVLGMAFPNILGLLLLSNEIKSDLNSYFKRIKSGEIKKHK